MNKKLLSLLLLPCAFGAAQTVPTAPDLGAGATPTVDAATAVCKRFPHTPGCPLAAAAETEATPVNKETPPPVRPIRPITLRSDFELFAEDAAGQPLAVYGRHLFDESPTTFAPVERVPVPADYVIGPGDELLIRVWGKVEIESRATVDRNGQISLPKVGTLNVAGLHSQQLEGFLRSAVGALYKDFELNVSLGQLRSIQVFVLGSARQPGAYTVSSLSTLVNALFASGGPSATGSMRHIQLRRGDRVVTDFDIYDLLRKGDKSRDVPLLPGDVVYIPSIGPQVALMGSVNEPGIYELKGETSIASALESAGGLANLAGTERVLLERIENNRRRRVDEFALNAAGLQRTLRDGDLLRIFPISPRIENAVTLRGSVAVPGRFAWHEGMRVSDLIPSREFLITRNYWNQQNHLVEEPEGHAFSVVESSADRINRTAEAQEAAGQAGPMGPTGRPERTDRPTPGGERALAQPQAGTERGAHTSADLIADASDNSAEINWEYAAIERLDDHDLSTRLIAFNLSAAIDRPDSPDNQVLKAGDVVTIFSRRDLELPLDKHATFVRVGGEVNAPGVYRVNPRESLREVVQQAGGLTPHSYLYASQLNRVSTRKAQEEQMEKSVDRMRKELADRFANNAATTADAAVRDQQQMGAQQALIAELSRVKPAGRVVLGMNRDASTVNDIPDFPLEDGDTFYVPPRMGTVQVVGSVYNENAFRYQNKRPLEAYLNDAGGATRDADVKRIYLIRADGEVVSRQSHGGWHGQFERITLLPGDAIIVPPKLKSRNGFLEQLPQITQIMSQAATTGAVLSLVP